LTGSLSGKDDPASFEHFGISIVESMALGTIPIALNKGGPREIINNETGRLCDSVEDFVEVTNELLSMSESERFRMSNAAKKRAKLYSEEHFESKVLRVTYRGLKDKPIYESMRRYNVFKNDPSRGSNYTGFCAKKV